MAHLWWLHHKFNSVITNQGMLSNSVFDLYSTIKTTSIRYFEYLKPIMFKKPWYHFISYNIYLVKDFAHLTFVFDKNIDM